MEIGQAVGFVGATIVLVGMPGPNNIYISLRSIAQGRRAGVVSAFAIETGTLVYALVAAVGLAGPSR
jgi:threonine/homoserine/homoserine lactone efflux protein